jgi:hypothetical protein
MENNEKEDKNFQFCSQGCFNGWLTVTSLEGSKIPCPNCNLDGKNII